MSAGSHSLKLYLLLALLSAVSVGSATAARDWNRTDDTMQAAVGLHAGKIGGVGLAYKYPFRWWLYGQVAGGIWHTTENKRHNFGVQLQYLLRQDDRLRLYTTIGAAYFYHKKRQDERTETVSEHWNTGAGIGVELLQGERISLQIEGDFTHEGDKDEIIFWPQVGLFFYF